MSLWGYAPSGTDYGAAGYRAGLTTHYSQNATYIVLVLLIVGSRLVCKKKQERSKIELAWFLIIMIALLLTSKRGHLIFGVAALVIVYYILNSAKRDSKLFKLIAGGLGLSIVVVILFQIMPTTFNVLLGRFVNSGYDDVTSGRLPMWALAISLFSKIQFWELDGLDININIRHTFGTVIISRMHFLIRIMYICKYYVKQELLEWVFLCSE